LAKRKKKRKTRRKVAPTLVVKKPRTREREFKKGELYRINVPGAKGYGVYEKHSHCEAGKVVHVFQSTEPGRHFHIPAARTRGIYRMTTATDWRKFHDVRQKRQDEAVREYKLSISDRTLLLNRGVRHDSRELQSSRTRNAVEKLTRLGLMQEGKTGYVLTLEGVTVSNKLFSSSGAKGMAQKTLTRKEDKPYEPRA
jgi:hypothetical protein